MDRILLCADQIQTSTSVDNAFITQYMPAANGSYVKVYLYLAMCLQSGERELSVAFLADKTDNTEKDILRALNYWEKEGLLDLHRDKNGAIAGIRMLSLKKNLSWEENSDDKVQPEKPSADEPIGAEQAKSVPKEITSSGIELNTDAQAKKGKAKTPEEKTVRLSEDDTFSWICRIVESFLERPVNPAELQLIGYLYEDLHFSAELILHLYEYCCSLKKTSANYVQAVALSWAEQGIKTPEQAQAQTTRYNAVYSAVAGELALGRTLAKVECEYVNRWQNEWHMDLAVIREACKRTMIAIGHGDFKYIDGILNRWHENGVHNLSDVRACDENYNSQKAEKKKKAPKQTEQKKTQFHTYLQREASADELDLLEKKLLSR